MKILVSGDWHLKVTKPENRTDDFFETQDKKLTWLLEKAVEEKCSYILQPGDLYDSFKIPHSLERYVIQKLRKYKIKVLTVFGQHDLRYHSSDKMNTPLAVLEAAKVVRIIRNEEEQIADNIYIYGVSWGEDIPEILSNKHTNILLMHKMVIDQKEGWEKEGVGVQDLFKNNFDLMVTGDNHKGFAFSNKEQHLINCGSLLRSNIDQEKHEPYVYIYNSDDHTIKGFPIPIRPFKSIMNIKGAEKEKKENEELGALIKGLKSDAKLTGLDFKKNLDEYVRSSKLGKGIIGILNEIMA